ncbi:sulfite exporter TauE/SafE family protein [Pararhizobium mangrovi]|uniref:Probable membrane transporter protein n=1 Tax=Pararhizobium mangrovi TaxID=2590452 RepID=A0A506U1R6_9HYPH|nr:sulfite exporter TauE/SafE family protein [Pararhizobium mangrovi]TPW26915.1 sulfite exporter TauE/SafE family protein [Pararhizobium mangrovi]
MTIYLPIAELSVNIFVILGMGGAVGFLSGLFGVGGGFLITPLLIFYNIPPAVAVATGTNQVVASSFSGALSHFRRGSLDVKLGLVLLVGGLSGSTAGIFAFKLLKSLGQLDLIVSLAYVTFLTIVGSLMMWESVGALKRLRAQSRSPGSSSAAPRHNQHTWVHRLPLKMRFRRSKIYLSVIPVIGLGFGIGLLTSIMGIGGGFMIVPAMIYLLRVPTNVVIGTSLFMVTFTTAFATLVQATTNHTVDVMLAIMLIVSSVIGVQYGVRVGRKLRGEWLRAGLALLVLAVGVRLAVGLFLRPEDIYSLIATGATAQ